jgi:hypothetical protein
VGTLPQCIKDLLSNHDIVAIQNAPRIAGQRHPTWYPIFCEQPPVEYLTNGSVRLISDEPGGIDWLSAQRRYLVSLDDLEGAAAALAEIRAYGALLEAGFQVTPIPRTMDDATPDFTVDAGDGPVVVEVFTKHQDNDQKQLLADVHAGKTPPGVERSTIKGKNVTGNFTVTTLQPGGAPDPNKPHDSVQANLISRICAAKGDESQLPNDGPCLLWIDFRSFGAWPEVLDLTHAAPLLSDRRGLTSGALWYAFYGWRNAPIFEVDLFSNNFVTGRLRRRYG